MNQELLAHLKKVYDFLEEINPENRDFPAWTIGKGVAYKNEAGTHPHLKFRIGVQLSHWPNVLATRDAAWNIEKALRQKLPYGDFHCADDVRKAYEVTECGLIFPEYNQLEMVGGDLLTVREIEYNSLRETHSKAATTFLQKIRDAGKLHDIYIWEGGMGGHEENSFFDPKGFFLRPPVFLNFLSGDNCCGGPEDFGLSYEIMLGNEPAFHKFNLRYNPGGGVLTIEDWGLWKLDNKCTIYLNPQPPVEQKLKEDSPLLKLLEAYR